MVTLYFVGAAVLLLIFAAVTNTAIDIDWSNMEIEFNKDGKNKGSVGVSDALDVWDNRPGKDKRDNVAFHFQAGRSIRLTDASVRETGAGTVLFLVGHKRMPIVSMVSLALGSASASVAALLLSVQVGLV